MSLLDAVRRLRPETYTSETLDAGYQEVCVRCNHRLDQGHAPDCPWLAMPRIVAALEAAERLSAAWEMPKSSIPIPGSMGGSSVDWGRGIARHGAIQEAEQALVDAPKGAVVP